MQENISTMEWPGLHPQRFKGGIRVIDYPKREPEYLSYPCNLVNRKKTF